MPTISTGDKSFRISSPFQGAVEVLQSAIDDDQSGGSIGDTWTLACAFVRAGADWPGWEEYHSRFRAAYIERLKGAPEYRDGEWESEKARKAAMWDRYEIAQSVARAHYMPEGVLLPTFLEGVPARPSIIRATGERLGIPMETIEEWFLRSFDSQRIYFYASADHGPSHWSIMRERGLVRSGTDIPVRDGVKKLGIGELRATLQRLGRTPERSLAENRVLLIELAEVDHDNVIAALVREASYDQMHMVVPPDGTDWSDFQSWRQQIRGMGEAVTDIMMRGARDHRHTVDFLSLTG